MKDKHLPEYTGNLRAHRIEIPEVIRHCGGIVIFGKRIKSIAFTTDVAIRRNINADAAYDDGAVLGMMARYRAAAAE